MSQPERPDERRPGADFEIVAMMENGARAPELEADSVDRTSGRSDAAGVAASGSQRPSDSGLRSAPRAEAGSGWPFT